MKICYNYEVKKNPKDRFIPKKFILQIIFTYSPFIQNGNFGNLDDFYKCFFKLELHISFTKLTSITSQIMS